VQRGAHRGQPGDDAGRRQVTARLGRPQPAVGRQPARLHAGRGQRLPEVPASGGTYCKPVALTKITDDTGQSLPVPSAECHRAIPVRVAQAVNYILQGVLDFPNGTAYGMGLANYEAAGKTGTSNVASGDGTPFAAFAGYTTALTGYVSVFNPVSPTKYTMTDMSACYQLEYGGQDCPGEMFGANAPASAWHMTFDHANLSGSVDFPPVPPASALWNAGNGQAVKQPPAKKPVKSGKGGGGGTGGGGPIPPNPPAQP
jgi:membrane peptidoglycan carboxypeptidase